MAKVKIVLVDDHVLVRHALKTLISHEPDMEVVGDVSNAGEALEKCIEDCPDVLLIDIGMPGLSAFEATRQIKKECLLTKVLFLTMYDDEDYLLRAMDMGASGFLLKDTPGPALISSIRDVIKGGTSLSPRMMQQLVDGYRGQTKTGKRVSRHSTLTNRELECLKLLAEGLSVKDIANEWNLSVKTVEAHKFNLMRKLDIHNKTQLVQYAIQRKIIRLPENPE